MTITPQELADIAVDLASMEVTEADVRALLIDGELTALRAERDKLKRDLDKVTALPPWWALSEKR